MPRSKGLGLFFRLLFSLWILYHLLVIVVMPNGVSALGRFFGSGISVYGSILGLNTSWNFFSPDPAHTMYLKFTVHSEDDYGHPLKDPEITTLPPNKGEGIWDLSKRRDLYAMRYMLLDPRRIQVILGPWLCRQNPGATTIHIDHVVDAIPSLDEASLFSQRDVQDLGREYDYVSQEYRCSKTKESSEEMSL